MDKRVELKQMGGNMKHYKSQFGVYVLVFVMVFANISPGYLIADAQEEKNSVSAEDTSVSSNHAFAGIDSEKLSEFQWTTTLANDLKPWKVTKFNKLGNGGIQMDHIDFEKDSLPGFAYISQEGIDLSEHKTVDLIVKNNNTEPVVMKLYFEAEPTYDGEKMSYLHYIETKSVDEYGESSERRGFLTIPENRAVHIRFDIAPEYLTGYNPEENRYSDLKKINKFAFMIASEGEIKEMNRSIDIISMGFDWEDGKYKENLEELNRPKSLLGWKWKPIDMLSGNQEDIKTDWDHDSISLDYHVGEVENGWKSNGIQALIEYYKSRNVKNDWSSYKCITATFENTSNYPIHVAMQISCGKSFTWYQNTGYNDKGKTPSEECILQPKDKVHVIYPLTENTWRNKESEWQPTETIDELDDVRIIEFCVYTDKITEPIEGTLKISNFKAKYNEMLTPDLKGSRVQDIFLEEKRKTLTVGDSEILRAAFLPTCPDNYNVTWESSDESVVEISNGLYNPGDPPTGIPPWYPGIRITAKKEGTAVITVISEDGNESDFCIINVINNSSETEETTDITDQTTESFTENPSETMTDESQETDTEYVTETTTMPVETSQETVLQTSTEESTQATTEEITSEIPTQTATEVITSDIPTQPATEEDTSEATTQNTTRETTSEVPTQNTTRETTSETPTETVTTEQPIETTIIDIPTTDAPTQRVTEPTTEQTTPEETTILVEKPKLDQASAAVLVGGSLQLTYSPENTAGAVLRWESMNPEIVTVTNDGKITGVKEGEAVVLLHVDDLVYKCVVSVEAIKQPETTTEHKEDITSQIMTEPNTTTEAVTEETTEEPTTEKLTTEPTTEEPTTEKLTTEPMTEESTQATTEVVTDASTEEPTQRVTEQPTQRVTETSEPTTTKQEPVTETTTKQEPATQPTTKQEPITETTTKQEQPTETTSNQTGATQPTSTESSQNNVSGSNEVIQKPATVVKVAAVKGLKYKRQKATAGKLSWKKQKGATCYRIYRYNKKTKKYQYYKATKKNYLALKKLKKKTTYQFKVRACQKINGKEVIGRYSKKVKVRI